MNKKINVKTISDRDTSWMNNIQVGEEKEKRGAALSSVVAAIFLTGMKLVVGLLTNSLGILAEAAHSALDLVAAAITYGAVRIAGREPDTDHPYGYGKVENLSALVETLLLLITCGWIIYEAMQRLFVKTVQVEATMWSFVVMGISIIVDISRSRLLMRTAKKYNSQALEADALHFSTDVWSSSVVIAGLSAVVLANYLEKYSRTKVQWLHNADAIAALGVSAIVIYISFQLGNKTIAALIDQAPKGMSGEIEHALKSVEGILEIQQVRVRHSGPGYFADVTISIHRSTSFEEAHLIASKAEEAVKQLYPRMDVMVHVDPIRPMDESLIERIWGVAGLHGLSVHSVRVYDLRGEVILDMHVEVPETLSLGEAHDVVTKLEEDLRKEFPQLREVVTHIEPVGDFNSVHEATKETTENITQLVLNVAEEITEFTNCHDIRVLRELNKVSISIHCETDPGLSVTDAHQLSQAFEKRLRERMPEIERVVVHLEPVEKALDELS